MPRGEGPFDPPVAIMMLNQTGFSELDLSLTADELEVFFVTNRSGANEVWTATRSDRSAAFSGVAIVPELTVDTPFDPEISRDGLVIRVTYNASFDQIRESRRASRGGVWSTPVPIVELNDPGGAANCCASANVADTMVVLSSARGGLPAADLFISRRALPTDPWGMPVAAPELNSTSIEVNPYLRDDGLQIIFDSNRSGGLGARDLYEAFRTSVELPFDPPTPVMGINTASDERDAWLSEDGHRLYFVSDRSGDAELYVAAR